MTSPCCCPDRLCYKDHDPRVSSCPGCVEQQLHVILDSYTITQIKVKVQKEKKARAIKMLLTRCRTYLPPKGYCLFSLSNPQEYDIISSMKRCHSCKKELSLGRSVGRRDVCPSCGVDLHCCLNCSHYDRSASKQCKETVAEMVKEKAKTNFCDYFLFAESRIPETPDAGVEQSRKALGDLFRK
jgi:hypothetical protein